MLPFLRKVGIARYPYGMGPTQSYFCMFMTGPALRCRSTVQFKKTNGQTEKFSTHFRLAEISIAGRTISESA